MKRTLLLALVIIALFAFPVAVSAGSIYRFVATLTGDVVNGPPVTLQGVFDYDADTYLLTCDVSYDLVAVGATAHVHNSGNSLLGHFTYGPLDNVIQLNNASDRIELLSGKLYVDVHSDTFVGGRIQGQILPVPEPSSVIALAGCAGGLLVRLRRR